jgi:hypothetical protein
VKNLVVKKVSASKFAFPLSFKGRYLGVMFLVMVQILSGAGHVAIGLGLIFSVSGIFAYNVYTFLTGTFTLLFAYGLWIGSKSGWLGTILVSLFVVVVDVAAVQNVNLMPGVQTIAALGEIFYSVVVLLYLFQPKNIRVFNKTR